jgi:histone arginine demethylase JMJD6
MEEYWRYCDADADGDFPPLYIFDPKLSTRTFTDGTLLQAEYAVPPCFSHDMMECITGSRFRPLPPSWLLVGAARSGTPIHDHPLTAAWNAMLVGCKLWAALPPDVDESFLLLDEGNIPLHGSDDDGSGSEVGDDFDLSALEWFQRSGGGGSSEGSGCRQGNKKKLPACARIIVQRPGEIVYVPAGWWHVVLNVQTSTALSYSLTLRRDLDTLRPQLREEDADFAEFWERALEESGEDYRGVAGVAKPSARQVTQERNEEGAQGAQENLDK